MSAGRQCNFRYFRKQFFEKFRKLEWACGKCRYGKITYRCSGIRNICILLRKIPVDPFAKVGLPLAENRVPRAAAAGEGADAAELCARGHDHAGAPG